MYENYIDAVRDSLYEATKRKTMPRTPKKIVFAPAEYKSEMAFQEQEEKNITGTNSKKRKRKQKFTTVSSDEYFKPKNKVSLKGSKRHQPPRSKKFTIKQEDLSDNEDARSDLYPSRSETSAQYSASWTETVVPENIKMELPDPDPVVFLSDSDSNDSEGSFTLSDFFDTREHCLNESVTEAHSGIEYEFTTSGILKAKISNEKIFVKEEVKELPAPECSDEETQSGDDSESSELCIETNSMDHGKISEELVDSSVQHFSVPSDRTSSTPPDSSETVGIPVSEAKVFEIGCELLVVLKEHKVLPFFGLFNLKVLQGEVEILGCVLCEKSREMPVYSPRGSSLLSIKNLTKNGKEGELLETILNLPEADCLKEIYINGTDAVFLCKKIEDPTITFIEKYISQQIFPKTDKRELPQVIFDPKSDWNVVAENSEWDTILETVNPSSKLFITGGKGVGKSTFVKYALNRLLNVYKKIRLVDLDPGQSEFTVPGCISYLSLNEPVLGPNYSHLKKAERSYLCHINVGRNPDQYLNSVKLLMREVDTLESLPTIINYMGFSSGIGLNIVSSAITHIRPSAVVQIDSRNQKKNFKSPLSAETVLKNCSLFGGDSGAEFRYELHKIRAMTDDNGGWTLEPRQGREMCVLAHLGRMMTSEVQSLTHWRLPLFEINLSSIHLADPSGSPVPPAAVNGSLVALCERLARPDGFACLGYGVVRGVDLGDATLKLCTPENLDTLEKVHYLIVGSTFLPPSVYMTPDEVVGHVPYVIEGSLASLGQITKRSYLPAQKK